MGVQCERSDENKEDRFAWVTSASLLDVRKRLNELRQARMLLQQEMSLLGARQQELDASAGEFLRQAPFSWTSKVLV